MATDYGMLDCVPSLIIKLQNMELTKMLDIDEVKKIIFLMNSDSACGPNRFYGFFYQ